MTKGFTIIELIIVIAIMTVITGFGVANFNSQREEEDLNQDVQKISSVLNSAKQRTLARDLAPAVNKTCTLSVAYIVRLDPVNNEYTLAFLCGTDEDDIDDVETYSLEQTEFHDMVSEVNISFRKPDRTLPTPDLYITQSNSFTLKRKTSDDCITLTINQLGNITISNIFECS